MKTARDVNKTNSEFWQRVTYSSMGEAVPPTAQSPAPARTEDIAPLPQLHTGPGWWMNIWKDKL
jgi:hypothetical protein